MVWELGLTRPLCLTQGCCFAGKHMAPGHCATLKAPLHALLQDHFRDFTQEDLRCLLPLLLGPRADPALKVPPAGRRLDDEQEQQRRHTAAKAAAEAARAAAVAAATRGGSEWDGGVDSRSNGLEGSPEAEVCQAAAIAHHLVCLVFLGMAEGADW